MDSIPNQCGKRCHISSLAASTTFENSVLHGSHAGCNSPSLPFDDWSLVFPFPGDPKTGADPLLWLACMKSASTSAKSGSELRWNTTPYTSLRISNVVASNVAWQILFRLASGILSPVFPLTELALRQFAEGWRPSSSVATKVDRKRDVYSRPLKT